MYYAAFLNLKRKGVLIFGGGSVALRKLRVLVKSGALVTAVSRDFSKAFSRFAKANRVKLLRGSHVPKGVEPWLVVAATSDEVFNQKIYEWCEKKRIFVNVVDDSKRSTFIVPSVVRRGALQIAISTGGKSPLLAKTLRKELSKQFGKTYSALIEELGKKRNEVKRLISVPKARRNHFQNMIGLRLNALGDGSSRKDLK